MKYLLHISRSLLLLKVRSQTEIYLIGVLCCSTVVFHYFVSRIKLNRIRKRWAVFLRDSPHIQELYWFFFFFLSVSSWMFDFYEISHIYYNLFIFSTLSNRISVEGSSVAVGMMTKFFIYWEWSVQYRNTKYKEIRNIVPYSSKSFQKEKANISLTCFP